MRISFFENLTDTVPEYQELTWSELAEAMSVHDRRSVRDGLLWCPAEFTEGNQLRLATNVSRIWTLALDIDDASDDSVMSFLDHVQQLGLSFFVYSSYSHVPDSGECRFRVVFELSRPVQAEEWLKFWHQSTSYLNAPVDGLDQKAKDKGRFYFTPSAPNDGREVVFQNFEGAPLDVDMVLALAPKKSKKDKGEPRSTIKEGGTFSGLAEASTTKPKQKEGGRNDFLYKRASLLRGLGLNEDAILLDLHRVNATQCVPPLEDAEVEGCARSSMRYEPSEEVYYPCTEVGNAQRFIDAFKGEVRWVSAWKSWVYYDGVKWTQNAANEAVLRRARDVVENHIAQNALRLRDRDPASADALESWSKASCRAAGIENLLKIARSAQEIQIGVGQFDANPWILNCEDGTIDLKTGTLRAHDPLDFCTKSTGYAYADESDFMPWATFLETVTGGDREIEAYLQRAAGYTLTGLTNEHCLFFLHGFGANGKSTFLNALTVAMGEYAVAGAPGLLQAKKGEAHPTDQADLYGARLVTLPELEENKRWDTGAVKRLTGDDTIRARRMNENFWSFTPTHKFWTAANDLPGVQDVSDGIWRRLKLVEFTQSFVGKEDKDVWKNIAAQPGAVLAWALGGLESWLADGLAEPESVKHATDGYRVDQDRAGDFFDAKCEFATDHSIGKTRLYQEYTRWCNLQGIPDDVLPFRLFNAKLKMRGIKDQRHGKQRERQWTGIKIAEPVMALLKTAKAV